MLLFSRLARLFSLVSAPSSPHPWHHKAMRVIFCAAETFVVKKVLRAEAGSLAPGSGSEALRAMQGSHRLDTLRELLYDTDWLERKLHNHGVRAVLDDFRRYLEERRDPQVHTLAKALKMAAPAALVHPALSMLGVQMAARLRAHAHQPLIPDW